MYSYEIAHLAKNFTLEIPIYFQNEYRRFFLLFPPNVLIVPKKTVKKNLKKLPFVKSFHTSNFYEIYFFYKSKNNLQIKFSTTLDLCYFFEVCTINCPKNFKKAIFSKK